MAGSTGRIFISYRREETAYPAGWLYDRLVRHFGRDQVFKDIDSIDLGDDFPEEIATAVGSCDVLLALVGDRWLSITHEDGERRLDHPDDFVRLEVEAALQRNVRLIPILVNGARMPSADELPPSIARMARRQALELSPSRFDADLNRLVRVLDETLAEPEGPMKEERARQRTVPAVLAMMATLAVLAVIVGLLVRDGGEAAGDERTASSGMSPSTNPVESTRPPGGSTTTATTADLFRAYILGRPSLEVRDQPGRSGRVVGQLLYNTEVFIVCTAISDPVTGPGRAGGAPITTRVWDKVRTERDGPDLGFVPDALVKTGTTKPVRPGC